MKFGGSSPRTPPPKELKWLKTNPIIHGTIELATEKTIMNARAASLHLFVFKENNISSSRLSCKTVLHFASLFNVLTKFSHQLKGC